MLLFTAQCAANRQQRPDTHQRKHEGQTKCRVAAWMHDVDRLGKQPQDWILRQCEKFGAHLWRVGKNARDTDKDDRREHANAQAPAQDGNAIVAERLEEDATKPHFLCPFRPPNHHLGNSA